MTALALGLVAALLWGLHDFTLRVIGHRTEALVLLVGVFLTGVALLGLFLAALGQGFWPAPAALPLAALAGLAYCAAGLGLYRAFAIGPVWLVAPICGAFPMLSVALEAARGTGVGWAAWAGAGLTVAGIALVARNQAEATGGRRLAAILWAGLACAGFAFAFALSQWAAERGAPLPVALVARIAASLAALALVAGTRPAVGPTLRMWPFVLVLGTLDVAALTLVTLAGGMARAEYASVAASIFGVVTILLAWRFLDERLGRVQIAGVGLVFAGIVMLGLSGHGGHG